MNVQAREILLFAPDLLGESLAAELSTAEHPLSIRRSSEALESHPDLVIWALPGRSQSLLLDREILQLQQRWTPSPILLVLPSDFSRDPRELLALNCEGVVQDPDLEGLRSAIQRLLQGGRVLAIESSASTADHPVQPVGAASWLLLSGLQQISADLQVIEALLNPPPEQSLLRLLLEGRRRELLSARNLLLWLWGPLQVGLDDAVALSQPKESISLSIRDRNTEAVWEAIQDRLQTAVSGGLGNGTGQLLAIEGLHPERRRDLLLALLQQLHTVLQRLRQEAPAAPLSQQDLRKRWNALQPEVRQQALRSVAGSYVRLPLGEAMQPVAGALL